MYPPATYATVLSIPKRKLPANVVDRKV
jgi:hypothetical protein